MSSFKSSPHILPGIFATILPLSLVVWAIQYLLPFRSSESTLSPIRCLISVIVPLLMLINAAKSKKLDRLAMVVAFILGFVETLSNISMMATTIAFFMVGTRATKFKRSAKTFEEDSPTHGRRNWIQVISNGGVGMELSILLLIEKGPANEFPINFAYDYFPSWLAMAFLGSMACACGDTLASELAPAITSAQPRLITNPFRSVPRGTNGGITFIGLLCSILGGLICGFAFFITMFICVSRDVLLTSPPQWPLILIGAFSGFFGSFVDSLLGATMQLSGLDRRTGKIVGKLNNGVVWISGSDILDNHSVNLMSTLITAMVSPYVARIIWASV